MPSPSPKRRASARRGPDRRRRRDKFDGSDLEEFDLVARAVGPPQTMLGRGLLRALPSCLLVVWIAAICLGLVLQARDDGATSFRGRKPSPSPLDAAFKTFGALFVPIAWSLRMLLMRIIGSRSPAATSPTLAATSTSSPTSSPTSLPNRLAPLSLALLYSAHAALRALFYQCHLYMLKTKVIAGHMMSDHVLLSSCVLAGLLCELYVVVSDADKHRGGRRAALVAFGILLAAVVIGMALEAFVTARHFHGWSDTLTSIGLGGVAFKWTAWKRVLRSYT